MNLLHRSLGVDHDHAVRGDRCYLVIRLGNGPLQLEPLGLEAILAVGASQPNLGIDPQVDRQVGPETVDRLVDEREHVAGAEPARAPLIGDAGVGEAVGDDGAALLQGRPHHPGEQVGPRRREEQKLGEGIELQGRVGQQLADPLRSVGSPRLADQQRLGAERLGEQPRLRALAGAVYSLEGDERHLTVVLARFRLRVAVDDLSGGGFSSIAAFAAFAASRSARRFFISCIDSQSSLRQRFQGRPRKGTTLSRGVSPQIEQRSSKRKTSPRWGSGKVWSQDSGSSAVQPLQPTKRLPDFFARMMRSMLGEPSSLVRPASSQTLQGPRMRSSSIPFQTTFARSSLVSSISDQVLWSSSRLSPTTSAFVIWPSAMRSISASSWAVISGVAIAGT